MLAKQKTLRVHGEKIEVKRCPFCGCWPMAEPWHGGSATKALVGCNAARCFVRPEVTGETPGEAAKHWNARRGGE